MKHTIGIVGGGQLGRMLTQAARALGFDVTVLDPSPNSPAGQVANKQIVGSFKDKASIQQLAAESDFLTFEIESANSQALQTLETSGKTIHPSPATLEIIKNKFGQKQFLRNAHIPVADFKEATTRKDIINAALTFEYPIVLKAKFDAYDGRGNALIESEEDIEPAMVKLAGHELYVEKFVVFEKELSVVAARAQDGTIAVYPILETIQKNHICDKVLAPANIQDDIQLQARDLAITTLGHLKGVGVFCIEMFYIPNSLPVSPYLTKRGVGGVLINEIAPRVHNAGHLTIEACKTSQFEQHIRAITGMSLGETSLKVPTAVMINILGEENHSAVYPAFDGSWEEFSKLHALPAIATTSITEIFIHIYGKMETKRERKMGHITVLANDLKSAQRAAEEARKQITI